MVPKPVSTWEVYLNGFFLGLVEAKSERHAINLVRFREFGTRPEASLGKFTARQKGSKNPERTGEKVSLYQGPQFTQENFLGLPDFYLQDDLSSKKKHQRSKQGRNNH